VKKKSLWAAAAVLCALLAMTEFASEPGRASEGRSPFAADIPTGPLTVMTYNVHGLPFPIARSRGPELAEIGARFADLRRAGKQPHVVVLQEAFTADAKAIARLGGYRFVAAGPDEGAAADPARPSISPAFDRASSVLKGEGVGKWEDSGLMVLSDYPILKTKRMAFPQDACAGYDCLAAKGAMLAWIAVPGFSLPVVIGDTHLSSRGATGVSVERANEAYAWQISAVRRFVRDNVTPATSIVFGGDFNVGDDPVRIADTSAQGGVVPYANEATEVFAHQSGSSPGDPDFAAVARRAKDKQYYRSGSGLRLKLVDLKVPFGKAQGGRELSDHFGYIASYSL